MSLLLAGLPFRVAEGSVVFLVALDACPGIVLSARRERVLARVSLKLFFLDDDEESVCLLAQLVSLSDVGVIES